MLAKHTQKPRTFMLTHKLPPRLLTGGTAAILDFNNSSDPLVDGTQVRGPLLPCWRNPPSSNHLDPPDGVIKPFFNIPKTNFALACLPGPVHSVATAI